MTRLLLTALLFATPALAVDPTAADILKKYDALMGPQLFESEQEMSSTREDGSTRTYLMRMLKRDADKFRVLFIGPAAVKGQEVLRIGDNAWVYLPNLKRATRIANRESFQGGDFNNADVLRVNYTLDYDGELVATDLADAYCLKLKARHAETPYESITLWVRKADLMPLKAQYFGTSGKLIRSAEFLEVKELQKGFARPTRIVMHNELVAARRSEMVPRSMKLDVEIPAQRFTQTDLGK